MILENPQDKVQLFVSEENSLSTLPKDIVGLIRIPAATYTTGVTTDSIYTLGKRTRTYTVVYRIRYTAYTVCTDTLYRIAYAGIDYVYCIPSTPIHYTIYAMPVWVCPKSIRPAFISSRQSARAACAGYKRNQ